MSLTSAVQGAEGLLPERIRALLDIKGVFLQGAALIAVYLVVTPFLFVIWTSLWSGRLGSLEGALTLQNYITVYSDPELYRLFANTLMFSVGAVTLSIFIGVSLAWLVGRTNIPTKGYMEPLILTPHIIPSFIYALMYIFTFSGGSGVLNKYLIQYTPLNAPIVDIYSFYGMFFLFGIHSVPSVYLIVIPSLTNMDPSLEEISRISGASMLKTIRNVTLPVVTPAIASAALITFIRALGAFAIVAIIGFRLNFDVFATKIWRVTSLQYPPQYGYSSALAMTLVIMTGFSIYVYRRITRRKEDYMVVTGQGYKPNKWDLGSMRWPTAIIAWAIMVLIWIIPIFVMTIASFHTIWTGEILPSRFTFQWYERLLHDGKFWRSMINTGIIAALSAGFGSILVTLLAYYTERTDYRFRGALDFLILTPMAFPGIVMGTAVLFTYLWIANVTPINLLGTFAIIVIGTLTLDIPTASRIAVGNIVQIHSELEEISRICGATWYQQMRSIFLPLYKGTYGVLLFYMAIAATSSLTVPLMTYNNDTIPVSVYIFTQWVFESNFEITSAISVIFIASMFLLIVILRFFGFSFSENI